MLILPGQLHSIEQYKDDSMEYENIIFSLSMLMPGNIDYAKDDFITPLILGKLTVPTLFTPVYPYYEDVIVRSMPAMRYARPCRRVTSFT